MAGELLDYAAFDEGRARRRARQAGLDGSFTFGSGAPIIVPHSDISMSALVAKAGVDQVVLTFSYADTNTNPLWQIAAVEVWIARVNDRAQASEFGQGETPFASFTHALPSNAGERYYWVRSRDGAGNVGAWHPSSATAGVRATALIEPNVPGSYYRLVGGKLDVSAAANALMIAFKTLNGNDPSEASPVFIGFQKADGLFEDVPVTAAKSIMITAGGAMETVANTPFRIWLVAYNSNGTVVPGVINPYHSSAGIVVLNESIGQTPVVVPFNQAGSIITTQSLSGSNKFRLLAYFDWDSGLATPGNWTVPTRTTYVDDGTPFPSDVIQSEQVSLFGLDGWTATTPHDGSIPQNSEGTQLISFSITPAAVENVLDCEIVVCGTYSVASPIVLALHQFGNANAICAAVGYCPGADLPFEIKLRHVFPIANSSSNFTVRIGGSNAGTGQVGSVGSLNLGGKRQSSLILREIMG